MFRPTLPALLAASVALFAQTPAFAQACAPERLNAAIDTFASEPFGALAWRQLNGMGTPDVTPQGSADGTWAAMETWRKRTAALAPEMTELQTVPYSCRMSYPLEVLEARVAKLGASDPYIKQWLKLQSRVMKACEGASADALVMPPPLEVKPELSQLQADDRAYQEASVAFYGDDKSKAVTLFKAIGASNSVHKAAARYNVANLLANAKNVAEARKETAAILAEPALASIHSITKELQGYIANLEDTADGWNQLIDNTVATLSQPANAISANERAKAEFAAALYDIDFVGVRDKQDDWWLRGQLPENPTLSKAIVDASRKHPMALWMMAGQSVNKMYDRAPWAMVGPTWNSWATSYVDRALALQPAASGITGPSKDVLEALKANADDASRAALWAKANDALAKAGSSCGKAVETGAASELVLQAVRLSAVADKFDEAYDNLAKAPITGSAAYRTRIVPKLMQHVLAIGNAEEGRRLRDRLITPTFLAGFTGENRDYELAPYSDFLAWVAEDETRFVSALGLSTAKLSHPVLNLLPAKKLRSLAEDATFSPEQKALLSRAAWTRDYARGRTPKATETENMLALNPDIKAAYEKVKTEFPKLRSDRQWLLTILRNPRFGILVNSPDWTDALESKRDAFAEIDLYDHNDKNWWCPLETDRQLGALRKALDEDAGVEAVRDYNADELKPVLAADAVTAAETARDQLLKAHPMIKAVDWSEVKKLAQAPSAPKALSLAATRWAKAAKATDMAAAEALMLSNKVVRYGCNWHGGHRAYSKPAQELLVGKFKATSFAQATPYWFDCLDDTWDAQGNKIVQCTPRQWPKQSPLR